MIEDPDGPLWYRGLADQPESDVAPALDKALKTYDAHHMVIGHTPKFVVLPRFGGKVVVIDVGLSVFYKGPPAFLIIEDGKFFANHRGERLPLPIDGADVIPYLKAAAALDPQPSPILKLIER